MSGRWWEAPFRTFQTNLREVDADLDVDAVLDDIEAYGADTWLLSVGGIVANHPSSLASQTVNPALAARASGDLVGDAVAAARSRGIRVLGRMDFSKIDARRAEEHPEWCFVSPDGAPQVYNGYRSTCPSGAYYQREAFDVLTEVLDRYDLAGFFLNWMSFNERDYSRRYWGVCRCAACLAAFREHSGGVAHPTGPDSPGYAAWQSFAAGVLDDLHARLRAHIRDLAPDVALVLGDRADVTFHEANNAVGRPLWHHRTAEAVSAARSGDDGRPVFVNAVGFVDMPYRWAGEDPHHFAQHLLQAVAHGAQPSTYVMGTPADSPFEALRVGGEVTRFHRDNADLYAGLVSTARVALVRGSGDGAAQGARRTAEFQGLYLGLLESHVPFDVVRQDRLAGLAPDRYALIVLPDVGVLAPGELAAVEAVLAAGGTVVATGDSGWSDGAPQVHGAEAVARETAVYATEESVRSLHLPTGPDGGDLLPVVGPFRVLAPGPEAETGWHAVGRALYGPPEKCYGHAATPHPGWVSGAVGGGRLALVPWRPGLVYRELGLSRARDAFVARLLALAGPGLRVDTDLPAQLQVVPGSTGRSTVVHLLNRSGDAPQRFTAPLEIGAGTLRVPARGEPVAVRARVAGSELSWALDGADVVVRTPAVGLFEALEIRWHNN
ncbi:alpha-amylase family protein [Isoptericola sp. BMS4]|uniref:alpha-amylase family protein n=1 Tax=Isoptericola sp. BMS4 TaxID=2527875 RepID=UPI0014232576|nr:alpha-amylase family protein [Isoptericola sp. BMS4]